MNIKNFAEGDLITRNEPCIYETDREIKDGSWLGDKMRFLGIDEEAKIFYVHLMDGIFADKEEPYQFSYARDPWDEGWVAFPQSLYERAKSLVIGSIGS